MISTRHRIIGIVLLLIAAVIGAASYGYLPEQVPAHWNAEGQVDGWMEKQKAVVMFPTIMLVMFLLFQVIGLISPKGFRLDRFGNVVGILQNTMLGFLLLVYAAQLAAGLGLPDVMAKAVLIGNGLMFVVIGNYLGKTRKNFFIGIRTPWTLASEEVWYKTHRLGGWLFVLAGVFMLLLAPFNVSFMLVLVPVIFAALVPVFYSLYLYHRLEGLGSGNSDDQPE